MDIKNLINLSAGNAIMEIVTVDTLMVGEKIFPVIRIAHILDDRDRLRKAKIDRETGVIDGEVVNRMVLSVVDNQISCSALKRIRLGIVKIIIILD